MKRKPQEPEIIDGLLARRDPLAEDRKAMNLLAAGKLVEAAAVVKARAARDLETSRRKIAAAEESGRQSVDA